VKKRGITAADLMKQLETDEAHQSRLRSQEEQSASIDAEARKVIAFLESKGVRAESIEDLVRTHAPLDQKTSSALLDALSVTADSNVLQSIIRALGASGSGFDSRRLADLFEKTDSESIRWTIANTLSLVSPTDLGGWLVEALRQKGYGKAREMLALAAARASPRDLANEALVDLLAEMPGHAAAALAEIGDQDVLGPLKKAGLSARGWEKTEISRAITIIARRLQEGRS
jgi:hypothetical protein